MYWLILKISVAALNPSIFSNTLSHLSPFVIFSYTALSTMAGNLFSGIFFTLYCHFNFLASLFVLSGYIPRFALNTVVLVVLEHPSIFLAVVICTVSSCIANFAFPSHTSPACSNFGAITFIRLYILMLECQGAGLLGSHPSCLHL